MKVLIKVLWAPVFGVLLLGLGACSDFEDAPTAAPKSVSESPGYLIGPGDILQIFVWRNPELSTTVPVRPDGLLSVPLIEDLPAANKTPTQLSRDVEKALS
jgi:polysaccharide export outer membrane protein